MKQGNETKPFFRKVTEGETKKEGRPYRPRLFRKEVFKVGKLGPSSKKVRIDRYKELSFEAVLRQFERSERKEGRKEERRRKFARARK